MILRRWGRPFAAAAGLLAWFALGLQLVLATTRILAGGGTVSRALFVYFGYFTILTNLLVAIALSAAARRAPQASARGIVRPDWLTAVAASIALVASAYHLLLRELWAPTGAQLVADVLLHYTMPALFLLYWWGWVPKASLAWRDLPWWTLYPAAYVVYALIRGAATGEYPYPFLEASRLGYLRVLGNAIGLLLAFLAIAALLVALGRWQAARAARP